MKSILIGGVGNVFQGDDAFGVEMIRELIRHEWPQEVELADFGLRVDDLAYALNGDYRAVILVDATARGGTPGTLYLLELDLNSEREIDSVDAHAMNVGSVLMMAKSLGGVAGELYLMGCEPAVLECESGESGLSEPVRSALPQAVRMVRELVKDLLCENTNLNTGLIRS